MRAETTEQKYNRLRGQIQDLYLKAYPNPERLGCPGQRAIENIAKWTSGFEELEKQDDYRHVIRCSPCYREYLERRREFQDLDSGNGEAMPKRVQKRLARTLDQLEKVMKSAVHRERR